MATVREKCHDSVKSDSAATSFVVEAKITVVTFRQLPQALRFRGRQWHVRLETGRIEFWVPFVSI